MRTLISCICPVTLTCYCRQFNNRLRLDTFLAETAKRTFVGGFLHETTFCAWLSVFLPLNLWKQFFFVRSFYVLSSLQFILSHCKPWWTTFFLRDCCLNDSPCQRCKVSLICRDGQSSEAERLLSRLTCFFDWKQVISIGTWLDWIPNFRPPAGKLIILNN